MSSQPPAPPVTNDVADAGPPPQPQPAGTLATISMALGIAALVSALVPFYGMTFAVPLAIAAIVLGFVAKGRPTENARHVRVGLVTGGLAIVVVLAWVAVFFGGFGLFSSSGSSTEIEAVGDAFYDPPTPSVIAEGDADTTASAELDLDGDGEPVDAGDGRAELTVGTVGATVELTRCIAVDQYFGDLVLRASGADGTIALTQSSNSVTLDVTLGGPMDGSYMGQVTGMASSSGGGLFGGDDEYRLTGALRELASGSEVAVDLTITCG